MNIPLGDFLLTCDRCHQVSEVCKSGKFSAGYYDMQYWQEFSNPNENLVCDWCIHTDQRYIDTYGETAESIRRKQPFQ